MLLRRSAFQGGSESFLQNASPRLTAPQLILPVVSQLVPHNAEILKKLRPQPDGEQVLTKLPDHSSAEVRIRQIVRDLDERWFLKSPQLFLQRVYGLEEHLPQTLPVDTLCEFL